VSDRIPLAQHTKASLDQLYDDLDQARTHADPELHGRLTAAIAALGKSETELAGRRAANSRVRALAARIRQGAPWTANDDDIADHILRALDGPNNSRTTPDNPATWTPPPPGDRREQLPDSILALLDIPAYTSTACEAAKLLERQMPHALRRVELGDHADRLHARCRLQNKFTGKPCVCHCHQQAPAVPECGPACAEQHAYDWTCALFAGVDDSDPSDLTGYLAPDPGIGCLNLSQPKEQQ
jgi:hypothetical protein